MEPNQIIGLLIFTIVVACGFMYHRASKNSSSPKTGSGGSSKKPSGKANKV